MMRAKRVVQLNIHKIRYRYAKEFIYGEYIETEAFHGSSPIHLWERGVLRNGLGFVVGFIGHHYYSILAASASDGPSGSQHL